MNLCGRSNHSLNGATVTCCERTSFLKKALPLSGKEMEYIESLIFTHFKTNTKTIGIFRVLVCCVLWKNQNLLSNKWARLTRDHRYLQTIYSISQLSGCSVISQNYDKLTFAEGPSLPTDQYPTDNARLGFKIPSSVTRLDNWLKFGQLFKAFSHT